MKLIQAKLKEVVRFKPVEKKDKFLMAFNHCIKSPVNEEIRKYKNIIHVV
ncbi:MAG: hypothetical protein WA421_09910 [Nitrososphaeraceae archaeon]